MATQGTHIRGPAGLPDTDPKSVAVKTSRSDRWAAYPGAPTDPPRSDGTDPDRGSTLGALQRPWEQVTWAAITQLDTGVCAEPSGTQDALALWVEANGCFPQEIEAS